MPLYFKKDDHSYNEDSLEILLEESVENALEAHYFETSKLLDVDYEINLDSSIPHTIEGDIVLEIEGNEEKMDIEYSSSRGNVLKGDYWPEKVSEDGKIIMEYIKDSIDSMVEMERAEIDKFFTNNDTMWKDSIY